MHFSQELINATLLLFCICNKMLSLKFAGRFYSLQMVAGKLLGTTAVYTLPTWEVVATYTSSS